MSLVLPIVFVVAGIGMFSKQIDKRTWIFIAVWITIILLKEMVKAPPPTVIPIPGS